MKKQLLYLIAAGLMGGGTVQAMDPATLAAKVKNYLYYAVLSESRRTVEYERLPQTIQTNDLDPSCITRKIKAVTPILLVKSTGVATCINNDACSSACYSGRAEAENTCVKLNRFCCAAVWGISPDNTKLGWNIYTGPIKSNNVYKWSTFEGKHHPDIDSTLERHSFVETTQPYNVLTTDNAAPIKVHHLKINPFDNQAKVVDALNTTLKNLENDANKK